MPRSIEAKIKLIKEMIYVTGLNLTGMTVLTELASNDFMFTPIIAKLAGASKVTVWGKDTRYGKSVLLEKRLRKLCSDFAISPIDKFSHNNRPLSDITQAHIITNSGMLRPLDSEFLSYVQPETSVIPLMYDAWEIRTKDADFQTIKNRKIRVCGVNEYVSDFEVFKYVGPLAAKMALSAGYEILGNSILIWSDDEFGFQAKDFFEIMSAKQVLMTTDLVKAKEFLREADFIFFCNYSETRELVSNNFGALFCPSDLQQGEFDTGVVHLYGALDSEKLINASFNVFPRSSGCERVMSMTLADLGSVPVLRLLVASLRAAQEVLNNEPRKFSQAIDLGVCP